MSSILVGLYNLTTNLKEDTPIVLTNETLKHMLGPDAPGVLELWANQYAANLRNNSQPQVSEGMPSIVPSTEGQAGGGGNFTTAAFNLSCPDIT